MKVVGFWRQSIEERSELPHPQELIDPSWPAHDGAWGFRIDAAGDATIEAIKLVREVSGLGLAEAKTALEAPRALIPIETRSSHAEIRRRFAALGYVVSFAPSGG